MYCTGCGRQLDDTARFCPSCGKPVDSDVAYGDSVPIAPRRRLRRIMAQKRIAGVCAGFAEYFETDVTLMRIIWLAMLILPPSVGLIGYIVAWIAMPKE